MSSHQGSAGSAFPVQGNGLFLAMRPALLPKLECTKVDEPWTCSSLPRLAWVLDAGSLSRRLPKDEL